MKNKKKFITGLIIFVTLLSSTVPASLALSEETPAGYCCVAEPMENLPDRVVRD